jgi:hypothetical protein
MSDNEIQELSCIIENWALERGCTDNNLLAFFCCSMMATMAIRGDTEERFDKMCEKLKQKFKIHPQRRLN